MNNIRKLLRIVPLAMVIALALSGAAKAQGNPPAPPACSNGSNGQTCCCNGYNCTTTCEGAGCCPVCPCVGPFCPPAEPLSVSVDDASVDEGDGAVGSPNLVFPIRTNRARDIAVVVQTNPGSTNPASENSDYAPRACTALIRMGDANVTVPVTIFGDTQYEPDETLFLHLTRAIELVTPRFSQTSSAAGEDPYDVKIGDLNGDGAPDLVVANDVTNDVSVLLNQGDGTYAAAINYPAGECADSVAIGDLNGDGKHDLAVAASCSSEIAVLLGDGSGAFAPAVFYPAGAYLVLLRDLNGDTLPDLVAMDSGNQRILRLLNSGSGFGAAQTLLTLESSPSGFDMADFNNDGRLDLAVSISIFNATGKMSVFLANAGGGFETPVDYPIGTGPNFVAAGDLNGDGRPDLVVSNSSSNNVSVLLNNGGGTFAPAGNYAAGADPRGLAIGDINGDGRPDVAVANQNGNNVSVLVSRGGGAFADAVNIPAGEAAFAVAIGDLDGNGAADLAVANRDDFTASVLLAPAPVPVTLSDNEGLGTIINDDGAPDTTPDLFDFADFSSVPRGSTKTSAPVTITGIDAPAPVSVSSGSYSVGCSGSFTTASGSIENGQSVCLRHVASGNYSTTITTTLTVGGVSGSFSSTTQGPPPPPPPPPPDTFPDAITFNSVTGVEPGSVQQSNIVTITGIDAPTGIALRGGEYRIYTSGVPGSYRTGESTVTNGQQVQVRHTASLMFSTPTHTDLFIGGRSGHFTSTTLAQDTAPDAFSFAPVAGTEPGIEVLSEAITVSGINSPTAISAEGGEYCIGTAPCGTGTTVEVGATVRVRVTSGAYGETVNGSLTIGGVSATFAVTTADEPPPPPGPGDPVPGAISPDGRNGTVSDREDEMVSVVIDAGTLTALSRIPQPDGVPEGFTYPNGFFEFEITGLANGATVTVTLTLPESASPNAYVKCDDGGCAPFAGASFSGNIVTLTLTDGGAGDADGLADGSISDPGAPAIAPANSSAPPAVASGSGSTPLSVLVWLLAVALVRRTMM